MHVRFDAASGSVAGPIDRLRFASAARLVGHGMWRGLI